MIRRYKRSYIGFILFLSFIATLGLWAFCIEPASLTTNLVKLHVKKWPRSCEGLRIVVLADLHVGSPFNGLKKLKKIVEMTNAENPDLVLLVGDYVVTGVLGGKFVHPESIAQELKLLRAHLGIFAVLGNHDWWFDSKRVKTALTSKNIKLMEDRSIFLNDGDCKFWLVGISDFWEGAHDVGKAFAGIPPKSSVLVMTHNPDIFYSIPSDISLIIAGHTHGGQVYLPLLGRLAVPSRYQDKFALGHILEDGKNMYVSPGIGTSILPVRFLVPPEISVLHIFGNN